MNSINSYIISCFLILGFSSLGQTDVSSWIGAEAKLSIDKKWSVGFDAQSRNDLSSGKLNKFLISPNASWKLNRHFVFGASYRLSNVPFSNSTLNRAYTHRYTVDASLKKLSGLFGVKKSRINVSFRLRWTSEFEKHKRTENIARLKMKADIDPPNVKLDFFVSTEIFYSLQRDLTYTFTEVTATSAWDKYRVKFGAQYPISDQHSVKLFGLYQTRFPDRGKEFVLGLGYNFEFKMR